MEAETSTTQTPEESGTGPPRWREVWQIPALVGAGMLLVGAIAYSAFSSPSPDFGARLREAEQLIERERYQNALAYLNDELWPHYTQATFSTDHRRQFRLLEARALFQGQRAIGVQRPENDQQVVLQYQEYERLNGEMSPADTENLALSLVGLGRYKDAIARAEQFRSLDRARRDRVYMDVVRHIRDDAQPDTELAYDLLGALLADEQVALRNRVWALARQSEFLMDGGAYRDAIDSLVRGLPTLIMRGSGQVQSEQVREGAGELYLLLGEAYFHEGSFAAARKAVDDGQSLLRESTPLYARALFLQSQLDEPEGELEGARGRYETIVNEYTGSPTYLDALLALAELEAIREAPDWNGDDDSSVAFYERVINELASRGAHPRVDANRVSDSLLQRFIDRFRSGDAKSALRFASLGELLFGVQGLPPRLAEAMALSHRRIADELLGTGDEFALQSIDVMGLDPGHREEARHHLLSAGKYFRQFSDAMTILDPDASADALWLSADSYDLGGAEDEAILTLHEFISAHPQHIRHAEARFRLAQAYMAREETDTAIEAFQSVLQDRDHRDGNLGVGPFGDHSLVPLARALLNRGSESDVTAAEELLLRGVSGSFGSPDSRVYQQALIELGHLYYVQGRYPEAISRLDEAMQRVGDWADRHAIAFEMADSLRLEGGQIAKTLESALPADRRQALESARLEAFERAMELFAEVRDGLRAKTDTQRSELQDLYLRNAMFYLGDCAFDLEQFEEARRYYDAARDDYAADPASLVALVQIVNTYMSEGDFESARTANERAKRFYESLPTAVWDDPDLPMGRSDWQRWLDSTTELTRQSQGAAEESGGASASAGP